MKAIKASEEVFDLKKQIINKLYDLGKELYNLVESVQNDIAVSDEQYEEAKSRVITNTKTIFGELDIIKKDIYILSNKVLENLNRG